VKKKCGKKMGEKYKIKKGELKENGIMQMIQRMADDSVINKMT